MRFEAKLPRPPDWRARTSGLVAVFTLLATLLSTSVYGTEVTRWQRLPIAVALHVGQERILFLDRPMRIAVPTVIAEHLRVQSADGAIYLRASEAFEATRVELQDADNGTLVLLDVTATAAPPRGDIGADAHRPCQVFLSSVSRFGIAERSIRHAERRTGRGDDHTQCRALDPVRRAKPLRPFAYGRAGSRPHSNTRAPDAGLVHATALVARHFECARCLAPAGSMGHCDPHYAPCPQLDDVRPPSSAGGLRGGIISTPAVGPAGSIHRHNRLVLGHSRTWTC